MSPEFLSITAVSEAVIPWQVRITLPTEKSTCPSTQVHNGQPGKHCPQKDTFPPWSQWVHCLESHLWNKRNSNEWRLGLARKKKVWREYSETGRGHTVQMSSINPVCAGKHQRPHRRTHFKLESCSEFISQTFLFLFLKCTLAVVLTNFPGLFFFFFFKSALACS